MTTRLHLLLLQIYDPYFCAGAVKRNLGHLGFKAVRNENEDCYKAQARGGGGKGGIVAP